MSDIFRKTYTVAEPGCGLTVLSMEGGEIHLFGSHMVIKTSAEDFFEPIKDFLHEKLVEEKADTMYYISMADTIVLGVLAGVAIVAGVVATFMSFGAATPLLGLGCVLAGAAISSYGYTKTLDSDRAAGRERSWAQFYLERTAGEFKGAAAGAVVFAGLLSGYELIGMAGGISSSIPSIVTAGTSGGTMAGAVEAAGLGEAVLGIGSMAALLAAAMKSGEGGESKEGVEFEKKEVSVEDLIAQIPDEYKQKFMCKEFADELEKYLKKNGINGTKIEFECEISDLIYSDRYGLISTNGIHQGVKVGDLIYDNLSTGGINYNEWLSDLGYFEQPSGTFKIPKVLECW